MTGANASGDRKAWVCYNPRFAAPPVTKRTTPPAMPADRLLKTGIIGTAVAALCCFTPLLVVALAAFGLSAWLGWADYVLLPAMIMFPAMAGYAIYRRRKASPTDP